MKINKADKGASGLWKHIRFHYYRGKGHLLPYLVNRIRWHVYPKLHRAGAYPDHVDLELSSSCNMVCPMCYTTTAAFKNLVPHRPIDYELFTRVVDELADNGVYSIRLSWRGEPTLHRRFMDCVRYAKERGIKEVSTLTNALRLTPEMFEELVDLQLDWLTISFDGTGERYEEIRKPAKFDPMVEKIRRFSEIKREKGSRKPVIRVQGMWPAIEEDPEAYFNTFEPIVDEVSVNSLLDYLYNDEEIQYLEDFTCPVPFQRLAIGSDGRAFMCVNDALGREVIGDANTQSISEIWNGPEVKRIREIQIGHRGVEELEPCRACYQPRKMEMKLHQIGDRTIELEELVGREQAIGK
jgi:radical SAM family protein/iron-sulfur cluster protein